MLAKYLGGADRERRIEKNRCGRHFPALHQVDQIDDQFLGAFDRESWDQQGALAAARVANLCRQTRRGASSAVIGGRIAVAIGRFRDHVVEAGRRLGIRLQQFGVRADVAGSREHAAVGRSCPRRRIRSRWRRNREDARRSSSAREHPASRRPMFRIRLAGTTAMRQWHQPGYRSG